MQDFELSRNENAAKHSDKSSIVLEMHLLHYTCLVKLRMKFWAWNPCNSTLVLLGMQQITFLILISLDKEDLELFTR